MVNLILKNRLLLVGVLLGALGGYLYYYFVGCTDGGCLITSRPGSSTLYGAVMGGVLMNMLRPGNSHRDKTGDETSGRS